MAWPAVPDSGGIEFPPLVSFDGILVTKTKKYTVIQDLGTHIRTDWQHVWAAALLFMATQTAVLLAFQLRTQTLLVHCHLTSAQPPMGQKTQTDRQSTFPGTPVPTTPPL